MIAARVTVAAVHSERPASFFGNVVMKSISYGEPLVNRLGPVSGGKDVKIRLKTLTFPRLVVKYSCTGGTSFDTLSPTSVCLLAFFYNRSW